VTTKKHNQRQKRKKDEEEESRPIPRTALSMEEFARSFGVSRSTAYAWMKEGLLQTFLRGRRRFVSVETAKQLAASLTDQAAHQ
jgi:transposase